VYIDSPDNEAFLGEASKYDIAKQICQASGPSGPNCEYLLELAKALRELELEDEHVFEIERCVEKIKTVK
jgi:cation transport protein ChaC